MADCSGLSQTKFPLRNRAELLKDEYRLGTELSTEIHPKPLGESSYIVRPSKSCLSISVFVCIICKCEKFLMLKF